MRCAGRAVLVEAGPQDSTAGTEAMGTVAELEVDVGRVVVVWCVVVGDRWPPAWAGDGEEPGPTVRPIPIPMPRAARTSVTTPTRKAVDLRIVMTCGLRFAT